MQGWKRQSFRGLVRCLARGGYSTEAAYQLSALPMNFTCMRAALTEIQTQLSNCDRCEIPELG